MPIKYIGAIMVFLSCGGVGFLMSANYRREQACLCDFVRLLDNMESELAYRLTPMPQLFANLAADATGCIQAVFTVLAAELDSHSEPDAASCMEIALSTVVDVPPNVRMFMKALGSSLGKFDLQGQLTEISAVRQQCNLQLERMRSQQDVRLRSYQTLGLCVGAGLAILLL